MSRFEEVSFLPFLQNLAEGLAPFLHIPISIWLAETHYKNSLLRVQKVAAT